MTGNVWALAGALVLGLVLVRVMWVAAGASAGRDVDRLRQTFASMETKYHIGRLMVLREMLGQGLPQGVAVPENSP